MGNLGRGMTFGATEEVTATKLHTLVDSGTVSNIVAADITNGVITDDKMLSVSGSKLVTLSGIPSGAGVIPVANIDTGTTASKIVKLDTNAKIPVCSGLGANDASEVTGIDAANITTGTIGTARLGSGSASSSNFLRGDGSWAITSGIPSNIQVFTTSGTWTKPAGVSQVYVKCWGSGGNGGQGGGTLGSAGGGGGGYSEGLVTVTGDVTVTVGTGGGTTNTSFAGSTTPTANYGTNASGGAGTTPGTAGSASGGTINISGSAGTGFGTSQADGSSGGSSPFGGAGGAGGAGNVQGTDGGNGTTPGGGGGGAGGGSDGSGGGKGNGAPGLVIVYY